MEFNATFFPDRSTHSNQAIQYGRSLARCYLARQEMGREGPVAVFFCMYVGLCWRIYADRPASAFAKSMVVSLVGHSAFPTDGRGFCRHRVFNTRTHSIESSFIALARLLAMPWAIPFLLFLSIPLFWTVLWIYLLHRGYRAIFPDSDEDGQISSSDDAGSAGVASQTPRSESVTPFFPATPFASPSVSTWRDMIGNRENDNSK